MRTVCWFSCGAASAVATKIRVDFPEAFDRMAKLERFKGHTVFKDCYLDELPPDAGNYPKEQHIECGIFCLMAEEDMK